MFALSVLAALGHLSQRERQGTGDADSHASDIGHWLGMTGQKQGAGAVDDPQVLLSAPSHIARKGECEGGTFDGFPHSRSVTRPQATDFAQQNRRSKKERHPHGCLSFLERATRLELASRHPANGIAIRRNPASPLNLTRFAQVEAASSNLPAAFQKQNPIPSDGVLFLERATRLELATSTLARSRSTR